MAVVLEVSIVVLSRNETVRKLNGWRSQDWEDSGMGWVVSLFLIWT